jgi:hypothetical protein
MLMMLMIMIMMIIEEDDETMKTYRVGTMPNMKRIKVDQL